jgi:phosphatidylserine synthase
MPPLTRKVLFGWLVPTIATALFSAFAAVTMAEVAFGMQLGLLVATTVILAVICLESIPARRLDRFAWSLTLVTVLVAMLVFDLRLAPQDKVAATVLFWIFGVGGVVLIPVSVFRKRMEEAKEEDDRRREDEERS